MAVSRAKAAPGVLLNFVDNKLHILKISKPPETVQFKLPKPYGLETGLKVLWYKKCW